MPKFGVILDTTEIFYNFFNGRRVFQEKFEDTKGVMRNRKMRKDRQHKGKKTKRQTMIYKTLHRKLKIAQHEPHYKPGVKPGFLDG